MGVVLAMEIFLLGSGVILAIICIYKKYKFYAAKNGIYRRDSAKLKQQEPLEKNQYRYLKKNIDLLHRELTEVKTKIKHNYKKLQQNFDEINNKIAQKNVENKFKSVLEDTYQKKHLPADDKEIPEHYKKVCTLFEEGKAPIKIARELDLGIRETNMILKFYQKGKVKNVK